MEYTLQPTPYTGPMADEVLVQRKIHLSAGQYHFYHKAIMLVEAQMQYCFDDKGKQFVDCYSNVCHVGHCHPHFVKQTQKALGSIISNTRYLHPTIVKYSEKLKSVCPKQLTVCYFVNSGSEANDLAMRLARVYTKKKGLLCLDHAYHGTTSSCTGISTSLSTGTTEGTTDAEYNARDVYVTELPDVYRGKYRSTDPECGKKYADDLKSVVDSMNGDTAAFIHESVQGVGGQIVYPRDFLKRAYKHVRDAGGVTIADEVQTGFGRTGTHFWAFEAQGVVPDILTLGKPIGNGFPLGAVITTREIAAAFDGVQYFNTGGGNPVACAAGLAVLEIIERDHLQQNAAEVSLYLGDKLRKLQNKHEIIGDVRGVGLFFGIELVKSRVTLEPAKDETTATMEICKEHGILIGKGGYLNNVLRIKPPLCFNRKDADYMVDVLDHVLGDIVNRTRELFQRQTPVMENTYINCCPNGDTPEEVSLSIDLEGRRRLDQLNARRSKTFYETAERFTTSPRKRAASSRDESEDRHSYSPQGAEEQWPACPISRIAKARRLSSTADGPSPRRSNGNGVNGNGEGIGHHI